MTESTECNSQEHDLIVDDEQHIHCKKCHLNWEISYI